jgi:hypothetical protein
MSATSYRLKVKASDVQLSLVAKHRQKRDVGKASHFVVAANGHSAQQC